VCRACRLFSEPVGSSGCFQAVLNERGFILEYSGFEHPHILTDGGFKAALFSGTTIYMLAPLQLPVMYPTP
jgi:hypothetical protein